MTRNEIIKLINEIFYKRFDICINDKEIFFDKSVFSPEIGLIPSDLVYVFFDIENIFKIKITEKNIDENMLTLNKMIDMIEIMNRIGKTYEAELPLT